MTHKCILILRYPLFDNLRKTPLHRHKFSYWCTVSERFLFCQVLFFSFVRLISFSVRLAEFKQWPSGQMGDEFYPHISVAKACGSPWLDLIVRLSCPFQRAWGLKLFVDYFRAMLHILLFFPRFCQFLHPNQFLVSWPSRRLCLAL